MTYIDGEDHNVCVVSASFYMVRYINDGKCVPDNGASGKEWLLQACKTNLEFYLKRSPGRSSSFCSHGIMAIQALGNTHDSEELSADSGWAN